MLRAILHLLREIAVFDSSAHFAVYVALFSTTIILELCTTFVEEYDAAKQYVFGGRRRVRRGHGRNL